MTLPRIALDDEESLLTLAQVAHKAFDKAKASRDANLMQEAIHVILALEKRIENVRHANLRVKATATQAEAGGFSEQLRRNQPTDRSDYSRP